MNGAVANLQMVRGPSAASAALALRPPCIAFAVACRLPSRDPGNFALSLCLALLSVPLLQPTGHIPTTY